MNDQESSANDKEEEYEMLLDFSFFTNEDCTNWQIQSDSSETPVLPSLSTHQYDEDDDLENVLIHTTNCTEKRKGILLTTCLPYPILKFCQIHDIPMKNTPSDKLMSTFVDKEKNMFQKKGSILFIGYVFPNTVEGRNQLNDFHDKIKKFDQTFFTLNKCDRNYLTTFHTLSNHADNCAQCQHIHRASSSSSSSSNN